MCRFDIEERSPELLPLPLPSHDCSNFVLHSSIFAKRKAAATNKIKRNVAAQLRVRRAQPQSRLSATTLERVRAATGFDTITTVGPYSIRNPFDEPHKPPGNRARRLALRGVR